MPRDTKYEVNEEIAAVRDHTRRVNLDIPYGDEGGGYVTIWRENALIRADGSLVRTDGSMRDYNKTGNELSELTFRRPDGTQFTGAQLLADIEVVADTLTGETPGADDGSS